MASRIAVKPDTMATITRISASTANRNADFKLKAISLSAKL
jgi:hypothetical protein